MESVEKITGNNPFESLASVDFGELTKYVDTSAKYPFKLNLPENDFDRKELFRFVQSVIQVSAYLQELSGGAVQSNTKDVLDRMNENNFCSDAIRKTDEIDTISRLLIFFAGDKDKQIYGEDRFSFPFTNADLEVWKSIKSPESGKVEFTFFRDVVVAEKLSQMANDAGLRIDTK